MKPKRILHFLMIVLFLFLACNENKKVPEQGAGQVVSPPLTTQEPDINQFVELDTSPQLIKKVQAKYPESAVKAGVGGTVYLKALVGQAGRVTKAIVVKRIGGSTELEQAAIEAAQQWVFTTPKVNGQPTSVWVVLPFKFQLK